jgi:(2S)-methylsuccinyl-CoA dehydrogenase
MADAIRTIIDAARATLDAALRAGRETTQGGKAIDEHQVHAERLAYAATEVAAADALAAYARERREAGAGDAVLDTMAAAFAAEVADRLWARVDAHRDDFGVPDAVLAKGLAAPEVRAAVRAAQHEARFREVGREVIRTRGVNNGFIDGDMAEMARDSARAFARKEVAPIAERIHRHDELVPESIIGAMRELGYFGMSVPEEYGGQGMGNLVMIVITEELSAASLAAAGSLITRPEILTKALLKGGTEAQKRRWLPPVAAGELMVGISVTEPDTGSDVASVRCKAERGEQDGTAGWFISGAKAWCTFAGRADVLALLARTNPDLKLGARGLSLFVVPKESFPGHEFEARQPGGGVLHGKADPTPGYRGMHSYTLAFERYFVPADHLIGEAEGEGKGFYLQMQGFAAGRLQTGGRASGLAQAALETTATYAAERKQFGRPIGDFQLTQYKLGRMATYIAAGRQLTYAAARAMDADETVSLEPAMAKLFASDVAVAVTQEGQLVHGGWGYAEEFAISRHVVDALVLPIFEGVKPILELKVIARGLLA